MANMRALLPILAISIGLAACGGKAGEPPDAQDAMGVQGDSGITIGLEPAGEVANTLPLITGARDPARPLVVIDPGHGGNDPGAAAPSGKREKDVTLAIAQAIGADLAASARVRVALTRVEDRNIPLAERYEIARGMGASLFISVHADAAPHNESARGATIYTLSEVASDREAALLAARENKAQIGGADLNPDPGVSRILIDLAQRESMAASTDFARLLHREAAPLFLFQPDYHRFASLIVLKAPDIPSILFECGYLTNAADEAFIHSPEGQRKIAAGVTRAVETYFARRALHPDR
ncbi:MAG: N-acetylmuramoyl-L-alanine amidase [Sphingosinicella sp.]|nr:N-acetylmuramoyl-L-alanine amidase [Sphingosinicella sp.]